MSLPHSPKVESVRQHHPADRAELPGDRLPALHLVFRDLNVDAVHGSMAVRTLPAFGLHARWYTILDMIKVIGQRIKKILNTSHLVI